MIAATDITKKDGRLLLAEGNSLSHIHILKIQILAEASLLGNDIYVYEEE
jgi:hypothetical protein|tara:strand:- start:214 stop:363 length:150 start_codon:yes stop_codon:yes gene_type:complete